MQVTCEYSGVSFESKRDDLCMKNAISCIEATIEDLERVLLVLKMRLKIMNGGQVVRSRLHAPVDTGE